MPFRIGVSADYNLSLPACYFLLFLLLKHVKIFFAIIFLLDYYVNGKITKQAVGQVVTIFDKLQYKSPDCKRNNKVGVSANDNNIR